MNSSLVRTIGNIVLFAVATAAQADEPTVDFNNDVRPILADKCFHCHGPDAQSRQADLRLDAPSEFISDQGGNGVVVVGQPDQSLLIERIESIDDSDRMPPVDSNLMLSATEQKILRQWIAQGAPWQGHWAYQSIGQTMVPSHPDDDWSYNPIDRFVLRKMLQNDLQPSGPANRETLIRRLSLDLNGLPPSPEEVSAFVADRSPGAYERLVDRLLASPRYGEHMSLAWLDAARYADTDGYQNDGPRTMWPWRDWVIDALNDNMPFDQFTIEQLAGDWIPNATLSQQIATGFNRNHRYNSESGLVLEEFLLENAVDRVDTVSTVWMGLTMGCARCHDHKFDPISQREYFQLVAFFDDVSESGRAVKFGNSEPWIVAPTDAQRKQLTELTEQVQAAKSKLDAAREAIDSALQGFEQSLPAAADHGLSPLEPVVSAGLTHHYFNAEQPLNLDGDRTEKLGKGPIVRCHTRNSVSLWIAPRIADGGLVSVQGTSQGNGGQPGLLVQLVDGKLRFMIITRWIAGVGAIETIDSIPINQWTHIALTNDGSQSARGMRIHINGHLAETRILHNTNSNVSPDTAFPVRVGGDDRRGHFDGQLRDLRFYQRTLTEAEIGILAIESDPADIMAIDPRDRTQPEVDKLRAWFLEHRAPESFKQLAASYDAAFTRHQRYYDQLPTTMVMDHQSERETFVRRRGVYSDLGERVSPATPAILPPSNATNRLEFAKWLVSDQHPLTARVAVNRYWQHFFGRGLVDTPEDFGVQGSIPSHPQLLDWLAREFQHSGWDVKQIHRKIVTSATYRQSSIADPVRIQNDPMNRWLARAPRKRLPAHLIRDQALQVSGLLVPELGGASVTPYQPANLWESLSNMKYTQASGAGLYRRSMYTFWKRTLAPPTMAILDAADRENCVVRPKRTNTPLQALTLLNEISFVEAARGLATRMLRETNEPIPYGFRLATGRAPDPIELEILQSALQQYRLAYADRPAEATSLLNVGETPVDERIDPIELAAYTVLANTILNLDEVITCD